MVVKAGMLATRTGEVEAEMKEGVRCWVFLGDGADGIG